MNETYLRMAKMLDHSLLSPDLTADDLENGITLAMAYDVASVCIMPFYMKRLSERLAETSVKTSTTIGFPHGGHTTHVKVAEAERAIHDGCEELDMVVNVSQVLSERWELVTQDISEVIDVAHANDRKVKVIFENCYLSDSQKIRLCEICGSLNADWVKTSTGYGSGGATLPDLELMRRHSPDHVRLKAAGGVRDYDTLLQVRNLGADRCGASKTKDILDECRTRLELPPIDSPDSIGGSY